MASRKIYFIIACVVSISLFFVVYSSRTKMKAQPDTPVLSETEYASTTLVAFGDSLTAGYGVTLNESYPSILQKKLKENGFPVLIINMGVSGDTTSTALDRLDFVMLQNPDIILLELGANDMLRSLPPEEIRKNIETMILFFKNKNKKIILLGMESSSSNGEVYAAAFDSIYVDLAKKYSLPLVPFFLEGVALAPSLNIDDGIHPNVLGYIKIVENNILPVLLKELK